VHTRNSQQHEFTSPKLLAQNRHKTQRPRTFEVAFPLTSLLTCGLCLTTTRPDLTPFEVAFPMGNSSSLPQQRVLLLGIDNAGKSSIVARLCGDEVRMVMPTRGCVSRVVAVLGVEVEIMDVGGRKDMRRYWPAYAAKISGAKTSGGGGGSGGLGSVSSMSNVAARGAILYVIDGADRRRLVEAAKELHAALEAPETYGVPLLVVSNKQDRAGALSAAEIEAAMHLNSIRDRPWRCIGCSALRGDGLLEAFEWLARDAQPAAKAPSAASSGGLFARFGGRPGAEKTAEKKAAAPGRRRSRRRAESNVDGNVASESSDSEAEPARAVSTRGRRRGSEAGCVEPPPAAAEDEAAAVGTGASRRRERKSAQLASEAADPAALRAEASEEAVAGGEEVRGGAERRRRRRATSTEEEEQ